MKKILFILAVIAILGALGGYWYINRPVPGLEKLNTEVRVDAAELNRAFASDESKANSLYLGKVIEVTGEVKEIDEQENSKYIILKSDELLSSVRCELDPRYNDTEVSVGETLSLKGKCSGYLMDVELDNCIIVNK